MAERGKVKLTHFSAAPLEMVHSSEQRNEPWSKPRGLWLSVDGENDWRAWCEAEQFGLARLAYATRVHLKLDAHMLWLRNAFDISEFHHRFAVKIRRERYAPSYIDWRAVAEEWQGIIIAPYCWHHRLDGVASSWYYGWDCASGVIWDAAAVASIRPIRRAALATGKEA